jgi:surface carbohydrate biosynthesis protein
MSLLPLIIPSETKSREFEPKLLLAVLAAARGHDVYVGSRIHIHNAIATLPRSIYYAKDVAKSSTRMFNILRSLGHSIVAWDEESLFYADKGTAFYRAKRTNPENLRALSAVYCWGEKDVELFGGFPELDGIARIATGSIRFDFLRPEMRAFWQQDADALKQKHGRYILLNTNFGRLNHFDPALALNPFNPGGPSWDQLGRDESYLPYWQFRHRVMTALEAVVPVIAARFRDHTLVIRPHPAENHQRWLAVGKGHDNVAVSHTGNVVPWLIGADVVVHNGCTTGLEAFLLGTPVIAYQPETSALFDEKLPNGVSQQATSPASLLQLLGDAMTSGHGTFDPAAASFAKRYVGNMAGPLAAENIVNDVDRVSELHVRDTQASLSGRLIGGAKARIRQVEKGLLAHMPNHKNSGSYTAHRFPDTTVQEVEAAIRKLRAVRPDLPAVNTQAHSANIFRLTRSS